MTTGEAAKKYAFDNKTVYGDETVRWTNEEELANAFTAGVIWYEEQLKLQVKAVINSMPSDEDLMEDSKI